MKKIKFQTTINASSEKLWQVLWSDSTYRQWTAAFTEGSYAESDWQEGSKILFLSTGGNGMFAIIEKSIPGKQMTFRHQGEIKNGVEEKKEWGNAEESYYLQEENGKTELTVEVDATAEFQQYFEDTFPKAMKILKEIAEK